MNKSKKTARTLLVVLLVYVAIGIIVGLVLYSNGLLRRSDDEVKYSFVEDESNGMDIPDVRIGSITALGVIHEYDSPIIEPEAEEETAEEVSLPEKEYYSFIVNTPKRRLMMRTAPNLLSPVVTRMEKGTAGYVLEYGEDWCLVTDGSNIGYSATEYLLLTELEPEFLPSDFPEEYR